MLQVERTASLLHVTLVHGMESCCHGPALCEARPRGTAFSRHYVDLLYSARLVHLHVNVLHCTSNSLRSPPAGQAPALLFGGGGGRISFLSHKSRMEISNGEDVDITEDLRAAEIFLR